MNRGKQKTFTVAITGASGAIYGVRLIQELLAQEHHLHVLISEAGWQVFREELNIETSDRSACLQHLFPENNENLDVHGPREFTAPIASGSYQQDGMFIVPCSMGTLSKIAHAHSGSLLERTADVMLKEARPLIIVPRETPLHAVHLENMSTLAKLGARIVPAMPGFYHRPESMDDLIHFVVGKVLDTAGVGHELFTRWGEK